MLPLEQLESPAVATPARFVYAGGAKPLSGYTIKRGIGHGGFGEVYYAVSDAGKEVALKLVRRNLDIELRGVTQCLNLKHPNLLSVFDIKQDDQGDHWIVMEHIAGDNLEQIIARHPHGLSVDEALGWFRGIAAGVAYLHDHGVVHRDLKPGNIFLDQGIVKLGDYGLSKFISCSRRSGQTGSIGTIHYMAPEIANGRYGKEIDVYALGVMLHEMLSGALPFEGESMGEILMKHLTAEPDLRKVSEPYRTLIARALAKDPAKRFADVAEMLAMLPGATNGAASGTVSGLPNAATPLGARVTPEQPKFPPLPPGATSPPPRAVAQSQARPVRPPHVEPLYWHLSNAIAEHRRSWEQADYAPGTKLLITLGVVFGLILTFGVWFVPVAISLMIYAAYFVVRTIVMAIFPSVPSPAGGSASLAETTVVPPKYPWARPAPRIKTRADLIGDFRTRAIGLLGSMLLTPMVVGALTWLTALYWLSFASTEYVVWSFVVATVGTWCVLVAGKIFESGKGEPLLRRLAMLFVGMGFGVASWALFEWLMLKSFGADFDQSLSRNLFIGRSDAVRLFLNDRGSPTLASFVGFWGFSFAAIAWWKQCDPLRSRRMKWIGLLLCACVGWFATVFVPFPQPNGMIMVVTIGIAAQLVSRWIPPAERVNRA